MSDEKFGFDLDVLLSRLVPNRSDPTFTKLDVIRVKLVEMHRHNLVKINHSVMEFIYAKHLILKGYEVDVEHSLDGILVCDVYGTKGDGRAVVEIETGFVPPEHALDPTTYYSARVASKIARYSKFADKFIMGSPQYQILPIPNLFLKPPRLRKPIEIQETKSLCDRYYRKPPVTLEEIASARIHLILQIDVDSGDVREFDPEAYGEYVLASWHFMRK
jgi:hypothetical protein